LCKNLAIGELALREVPFVDKEIGAFELSQIYVRNWIEQSTALSYSTKKEIPLVDVYREWEYILDCLENDPNKLLNDKTKIWHISDMRNTIQDNSIKKISPEAGFLEIIKETNILPFDWNKLSEEERAIELALVQYKRAREFCNNMQKIWEMGMKATEPKSISTRER